MGWKSEATKNRILIAAKEELLDKGIREFSIENVAERANTNKGLVYRYVGNREAVIEEAFKLVLEGRQEILARQSASLEDALKHWISENSLDREFFRLITEEALLGSPKTLTKERHAYYQEQVRALEKVLPSEDPEMTFAALLAITVFPFVLPNILHLISDSAFSEERYSNAAIGLLKRIN